MNQTSRIRRARASELIVAQYLASRGWSHALPVGPSRQGSDILNVPMDVEVFARRDGLSAVTGKLAQSDARATGDRVLVMRPDGWGAERVHMWPAILRLEEYVNLYKRATR